jgi:hypothetical protein
VSDNPQSTDCRAVEIVVPPGYRSGDDFLVDCGFKRAEQPPLTSTPEMRNRLRELAQPARDDFDRGVLVVLDDLEQLVRRYGL